MNDLLIFGGGHDPLEYKGNAPRETIFSAAQHCSTDLPQFSVNCYLALLRTTRLRTTLLATASRAFWFHSRREAAQAMKLFPMPLSTLGGWRPDSNRAMRSIAVNIASRTLNSLEYASETLFQRLAALLVANNAVCLISGFDLRT